MFKPNFFGQGDSFQQSINNNPNISNFRRDQMNQELNQIKFFPKPGDDLKLMHMGFEVNSANLNGLLAEQQRNIQNALKR